MTTSAPTNRPVKTWEVLVTLAFAIGLSVAGYIVGRVGGPEAAGTFGLLAAIGVSAGVVGWVFRQWDKLAEKWITLTQIAEGLGVVSAVFAAWSVIGVLHHAS